MTLPSIVRRFSRLIEGRTLLTLLAVCGSIWAFIVLSGEVMEGDTRAFDIWLLLALRDGADPNTPYGPEWLQEFGRDVTALGSMGVLSAVTLAFAGFLGIRGDTRSLVLVLAAVVSGIIVSSLLKSGFDRPRPDLVPHGARVFTPSFPSGHAMISAVTYLTIAALVARVQPQRRMKAYILSVAAVLTGAIGLSRIYLGVHWPTDVLAGWAAGAAWALLWWMIATWLEGKGLAEPELPEEGRQTG